MTPSAADLPTISTYDFYVLFYAGAFMCGVCLVAMALCGARAKYNQDAAIAADREAKKLE